MTREERALENFGGGLGAVVGVVAFLGAWAYCAVTYGFLFGFGLGWLPAAILGAIMAGLTRLAWPIAAVALVAFALLCLSS